MTKQQLNQKIRFIIPFVALNIFVTVPGIEAQDIPAAPSLQDADSLKYNQIVDVAFGKQPYNSVTSSISTVYSADLTKQLVPVVGDALVGRLPGLTVRKSSGIPGSPPDIYIRGQGTYNSNLPLVIVDGFRADYNQLSIYEIESVSILKDAAATVLYGMDAANGVLLVTTKRGRNEKLKVDVNLNYGIQQPTQLPELLDAAQYANYYNQARVNDGLPEKYSASDIASYGQDGNFKYTHPDNDFINDFLKKSAPIVVGGLNISSGNEKAKYMVALGYLANKGILNQTNSNKYSTQAKMDKVNIRTNLDVNIMKGLDAAVDVVVAFDNRNYPGNSVDNIINTLIQTPPQAFPIINPNGSLGGNATYKNNPMAMIAQSGYQTSLQRNLDVNLRLGYTFDNALKGLSLQAAGSSSTWMTLWDNKTRSYATYSIDNPDDLVTTT
jgi:TonB-dependent SusC/RagA subfamily outer membrane receptor